MLTNQPVKKHTQACSNVTILRHYVITSTPGRVHNL
jgi:hypothetical protein